jgi:hypothetical protein
MFGKHKFLLSVLILSLLCACLAGCGSKSMTKDQWREDIDYLAGELPQRYIDLFNTISEEEFSSRAEHLKASLDTMNEDEIRVEIQRLVAAVGDAHTGTNFSAGRMYPVELYWFVDGWYVIRTLRGYEQILYGKLTQIEGHDVEEVSARLSEVISHENDAWLKAQMRYYFMIPSVLHGLQIVDDPQAAAAFTFETRTGESAELDLAPVNFADVQDDIIGQETDQDALPLYMQNGGQNYWYTYLEEDKTLYFKYNQCSEMADKSFSDFTQELLDTLDNGNIEKLVIDLRDNGGGDEELLFPFIHAVSHSPLNQEGRLFIIVGRQTFSSAVRNAVTLQKKTGATFIGEPTGGKPSHFGAAQSFQLPNSKIMVTYSTMHLTHCILDDRVLADPSAFADDPSALEELEQSILQDPDALIGDAPSLIPDQVIESSIQDYIDNLDPVLRYALDY